MKPSCDCIAKVNKMLEPRGCELDTILNLGSGHAFPVIKTMRLDGRPGRPAIQIASYCPFCGVKYTGGGS